MNRKITITDLINPQEIASWKPEQPVLIASGTGTGKSHFIKKQLAEYAKAHNQKILLLVNRAGIKEQFLEELEGEDKPVTVMTYQKIEDASLRGKELCLDQYDYLVCDEFHYFLEDGAFNERTDVSLNVIMQQEVVKIFMSATGEEMAMLLMQMYNLESYEMYTIPDDYSFIESLSFYYKPEDLEEELLEIAKTEDKAMVFIQQAEEAYRVAKLLGEKAFFSCSLYNKRFSRKIDMKKRKNMLKNERFDSQFFVTTSALDTGINIKDEKVKHIFIDLKYVASIIQAIGRKRCISVDDKVHVHIRALTNNQLAGLKRKTLKELQMANDFKKLSLEDFFSKYPRQNYDMIFDEAKDEKTCTKKLNKLMYYKKAFYIQNIDHMISKGNHGFCKVLAARLNRYNPITGTYDYTVSGKKERDLINYLKNKEGKMMLTKDERKELIETINLKLNGRLVRGREALNAALRDRNLPYEIQQFRNRVTIDGKTKDYKAIWMLRRI